jgi:hypothetical protein
VAQENNPSPREATSYELIPLAAVHDFCDQGEAKQKRLL